ncbi:hypothetical protein GIB67_012510 [Kingdonia uniflora]|uniref:ribonuclease Z n=1 Tax=Kingdonia uniflora TaxID=39325 RepID=A0A7J7MVM3_9MAGN|nr:hypothetical protein GIB67_012510 [Kingdonia uniflora]
MVPKPLNQLSCLLYLIGLLLTLAGMGDEGMPVKIWGPSDLKYLADAMRMFIPNAAMIHTHSFGPAPNADEGTLALANFANPIILIDDEVVKISAILLRPSFSGSSHLAPASINLKPGDIFLIYICELSKTNWKFDPAKAKAHGLYPRPNYHELQLGNLVMSDHQNIMVHPTDVLDIVAIDADSSSVSMSAATNCLAVPLSLHFAFKATHTLIISKTFPFNCVGITVTYSSPIS